MAVGYQPITVGWSGDQGQRFGERLGETGGVCWTSCGHGPPYWSPHGLVLHNLAAIQLDVPHSYSSSDGPHCYEGLCRGVDETWPAWFNQVIT